MAEFIPCAGFSPSCEAVLVQTEHCASEGDVNTVIKKITINMQEKYFISTAKLRQPE